MYWKSEWFNCHGFKLANKYETLFKFINNSVKLIIGCCCKMQRCNWRIQLKFKNTANIPYGTFNTCLHWKSLTYPILLCIMYCIVNIVKNKNIKTSLTVTASVKLLKNKNNTRGNLINSATACWWGGRQYGRTYCPLPWAKTWR